MQNNVVQLYYFDEMMYVYVYVVELVDTKSFFHFWKLISILVFIMLYGI